MHCICYSIQFQCKNTSTLKWQFEIYSVKLFLLDRCQTFSSIIRWSLWNNRIREFITVWIFFWFSMRFNWRKQFQSILKVNLDLLYSKAQWIKQIASKCNCCNLINIIKEIIVYYFLHRFFFCFKPNIKAFIIRSVSDRWWFLFNRIVADAVKF